MLIQKLRSWMVDSVLGGMWRPSAEWFADQLSSTQAGRNQQGSGKLRRNRTASQQQSFTTMLEQRVLLAATTFWQDNFEGGGPNQGGGTRTAIDNNGTAISNSGSLASGDYFLRTTDAATGANVAFTGHTGNLWRAEDMDGLGFPLPAIVEWTGIDIAGKTDLTFSGLFAAYDGSATGLRRFETNNFLRVEYEIDSGGFVQLLDFRGDLSAGAEGNLRLDTNGDGEGDGIELIPAMTLLDSIGITGTGTTLTLRISTNVDGNSEEIAFDNITLASDVAGAPEIDVRGLGQSITSGDITPTTTDDTDFGPVQLVGAFHDHTFTIHNTGDGPLDLTGSSPVSISGTNAGDFTVTQPTTDPVPAGGSTTFTIRFDPSAAGLRTATVTIANDDGDEGSYTFDIQGFSGPEIAVSGNGVEIATGDTTPNTADHTDFGVVDETSGTISRTFTITNDGPDTLNLTNGMPLVQISGTNAADFTVTTPPSATVTSGNSTTFTIEFDPSSTGLRTAIVTIANDDPDENLYTFDIQGAGRGVAFWQDDFEGAGPNQGTGTRTAIDNNGTAISNSGSLASGDYFLRTTDAATGANVAFTGHTGNLWRAEDMDGLGFPLPAIVEWTGIDITGKTGLTFNGLFAAYDGSVTGLKRFETDNFLRVEYEIDSGGFVQLLDFRGDLSAGAEGNLRLDTNGDGVGDGIELVPAMTLLDSIGITGTGTTLTLRISTNVEGNSEEIAFDNITLHSQLQNTPPSVALTDEQNSLPESTDTSARVKVANIVITDDGNGTNNLTLSGADASSFEIDNFELFLKQNTSLDFETQETYNVTVNVDDTTVGSTPDASANFTLTITDVNEAPTAVVLTPNSETITEYDDTTNAIALATIAVTDDALGTNDLSVSGADAAFFEIIGNTLRLKAGVSLDFETKPSYSVTVEVDDTGVGSTPDASANFTLTITDINETPRPEGIIGRNSTTGDWNHNTANSAGNGFDVSTRANWDPAVTWINVVTGDFNDDGDEDIAGRNQTTGRWQVSLSGSSGFTNQDWGSWSTAVTWIDVQVGDFTGDGIDDVAGRVQGSGNWWIAESTLTSFANVSFGNWSTTATWIDVVAGDFNGDTITDIAGRVQQSGQWWVAVSNGSQFQNQNWGRWSTTATWVDVLVGDFNRDGNDDIMGRVQESGFWWNAQSNGTQFTNTRFGQWATSETWLDVMVGDFNGDLRTDIAGRVQSSGNWWISTSTGTSFEDRQWGRWSTTTTWLDVTAGDFNGDGRDDLAGRTSGSGNWWVALSSGRELSQDSSWAIWDPTVTWDDVNSGNFSQFLIP